MPKPTDSICMRISGPVAGCPARRDQLVVIQDDGPKRQLTIRIGNSKKEAEASEPVGMFGIAFLRDIVGEAMFSEEELKRVRVNNVISIDSVRKRWKESNAQPPGNWAS